MKQAILIFLLSAFNVFATCSLDDFLEDRFVEITSGYRTKSHNKRVGGASNSWHLHPCGARDILKSSIKDVPGFIKNALNSEYRIIEYKYHIHIDLGQAGHLKGTYNGR